MGEPVQKMCLFGQKGKGFKESLSCALNLDIYHPSRPGSYPHTFRRQRRDCKSAASASVIGLWTREVYLSFSREFGTSEASEESIWNRLVEIFSRTPFILALCLQTSSEDRYDIDSCVSRLSVILSSRFTRLRTLRLYSDKSNMPRNGLGT